jgi:hypothetical protein
MKPQHQLATSTCFGTRPFYALLPSVLFAFIGDSRKHQPNLRTGPDSTSGNVTVYRSADRALAMSSHRTPIQTP